VTYLAEGQSREHVMKQGCRAILDAFAKIYPHLEGQSRHALARTDSGSPRARVAYLADVTQDGQYFFSLWHLPSPQRPKYVELDALKARIELLMWVRILTMQESEKT
jgi:hypothetical protein